MGGDRPDSGRVRLVTRRPCRGSLAQEAYGLYYCGDPASRGVDVRAAAPRSDARGPRRGRVLAAALEARAPRRPGAAVARLAGRSAGLR